MASVKKLSSLPIAENEVPLNEAEMEDIWEMFHSLPNLMSACDAMMGKVLRPEIEVDGGLGIPKNPEFRLILENYWKRFFFNVFLWFVCFGVVPWYKRTAPSSKHPIPVVPEFKAGSIKTFKRGKKPQGFRYYWHNANDYDGRMHFEVFRHPPDLDGHIRSPLASLLLDWRTTKIVRTATEAVSYQQGNQQHIFEFHPSKTNNGDDNLQTLEAFGEAIAGNVLTSQEALRARQMTIRMDNMQFAVAQTMAANKGLKLTYGGRNPIMRSEFQGERWDRENANLLSKGIPLGPDFHYKPVPSPSITVRLGEFLDRLERNAMALLGVPAQVTQASGGKTTANVQNNLRFMNDQMKDWTQLFESVGKRVFLILYEGTDVDYLYDRISFIIPSTPDVPVQDIFNLVNFGYMDKKDAAKRVFDSLGLPREEITISEGLIPPKAPQSGALGGVKKPKVT